MVLGELYFFILYIKCREGLELERVGLGEVGWGWGESGTGWEWVCVGMSVCGDPLGKVGKRRGREVWGGMWELCGCVGVGSMDGLRERAELGRTSGGASGTVMGAGEDRGGVRRRRERKA